MIGYERPSYFTAMDTLGKLRRLPTLRWYLLATGMFTSLFVYYAHYGGHFDEGESDSSGALVTLPLRILGIVLIVSALLPVRSIDWSVALSVVLFVGSGISLLLSAGMYSGLNDSFFLNTLLQLPLLVVFTSSIWEIDFARLMRMICCIVAFQVLVDCVVLQFDRLLWISTAFVGGMGNPSSFGLVCTIGFAFCLHYPQQGKFRWVLATLLAIGAVQSKALFAAIGLALVALAWMAKSWRRFMMGTIALVATALIALTLLVGNGDDNEFSFLEHKLNAVGALIGFVEYDIESSASVSQRVEMHKSTFDAISEAPQHLIYGHLNKLPYWPMDSQVLTYLGSFGALMAGLFVALHLHWLLQAWYNRRFDGGFSVLSLMLFGLIFTTNRILDYFPVATVYFALVAMAIRPHKMPRVGGKRHQP